MTTLPDEVRGFIEQLLAHGVPIFLAEPDPAKSTGFRLPQDWQYTRVDTQVLDRWRPGMALCAVGGHGIDFVDIDPRNGGDLSAGRLRREGLWPRVYATVTTPSGGTHDYVASLRIGKKSRDGIDLQGGLETGSGRGFAFLPGTWRGPNPGGKPEGAYSILRDDLRRFGRDDDSGEALARWIGGETSVGVSAPGASGDRNWKSPHALGQGGDLGQPIPHGEHDNTLAAFVARLVAAGHPREHVRLLARGRVADCVDYEAARPFGKADFDRWWRGANEKYGGRPVEGPVGERRIVTRKASDFTIRPILWSWLNLSPVGALTVFAGRAGVGKSTAVYWAIARLSKGELPGEFYGTPRDSLVCATEDGWEDTIVPRLMAAGADLDRIHHVAAAYGPEEHPLDLTVDTVAAGATARELGASVILLDPLMSRLGKMDTHKDSEVRKALEPLKGMAEEGNCSVWGISHLNKSSSADPANLLMGSVAFGAVARSVVMFSRDTEDDSLIRMGGAKANLTRVQGTWCFRIAESLVATVPYQGQMREIRIGHAVNWERDDGIAIEDVLGAHASGEEAGVLGEACEWLRDYLIANGGEASRADVFKSGRVQGFSQSALRRARERVADFRRTHTSPPETVWALRVDDAKPLGAPPWESSAGG